MVRRTLLCSVVALLAVLTGSTCKVLNEDHCANQDVPGNEFCLELNTATPYCSPCRREYHGCVDYEPYACGGYDNEIGDPVESSTSDAPESTSDAPASTSDASTSDASTSTGTASSSGSGGR
jgi:hypothetical protein